MNPYRTTPHRLALDSSLEPLVWGLLGLFVYAFLAWIILK